MTQAIIIDDEERGRKALKTMLSSLFPGIQLAGEAEDVKSGLELIRKTNPQIVLLDIEMPDGTGFDILRQVKNPSFEVIFTTAFDEYALEAFKYTAIGYLLKPIGEDDLQLVVSRTLKMLGREEEARRAQVGALLDNYDNRTGRVPKLFLPDVEGFQVIATEQIIRLEGDRNYTHLFLTDGRSVLSSYNLGHFEKVLSGSTFFRLSKSHIANVNCIVRYSRADGGSVLMSDGSSLTVSDTKKESLKQLFIGL